MVSLPPLLTMRCTSTLGAWVKGLKRELDRVLLQGFEVYTVDCLAAFAASQRVVYQLQVGAARLAEPLTIERFSSTFRTKHFLLQTARSRVESLPTTPGLVILLLGSNL